MKTTSLQSYSLLALITVVAVVAFFIFQPFLVILILAAVFAVVLQPLYRAVLKRMPKTPGLAAFLSMLITLVVILIPLLFIVVQIVGDAQSLYLSLTHGRGTSVLQYIGEVVAQYVPGMTSADFAASVDEYIRGGLTWLIQHIGGAISSVAKLLLGLFIFLVALYYFLRDGSTFKKSIIQTSPLADSHDETVIARLELSVNSVMRGSLMIALIQGVLTSIGFAIFGVPNAILWGVVALIAALIPGIGTSLVLVPGVLYLALLGGSGQAIGLLIWSVVAVGLIDNILGPRLVGKGMQMHPLVVLLSVLGGLTLFGPVGIFLGPLSMSLLFTLFSIYQEVSRQSA